jgi:hypothetical protein
MNLPGFNAEASLYRAGGQYRSSQSPAAPAGENRAVMQLRLPRFPCRFSEHEGARFFCCTNPLTGEESCFLLNGPGMSI